MYEDKTLVCKECGNEFVFTAGEQEFYAERGFQNEPQRCKSCRDARKSAARGPREYFTAVLVKTSDVPPGGESEEDSNGGLPAGYAYQQVELGLSDDSYVEIVSGLSEGDQVAYQQTSSMGGMFASFAISGGGPEGGPPPDGGGGPGGGY